MQKPFPKEAELSEKMERLAELNAMLNMDEKGGENLLADEGIGENPEVVAVRPLCAASSGQDSLKVNSPAFRARPVRFFCRVMVTASESAAA